MTTKSKERSVQDDEAMVPLSPATHHVTAGKTRLVLVRNGEPMDRVLHTWHFKSFPDDEHYRLCDLNQPARMLRRPGGADAFKNDAPLTALGTITAQFIGHALRQRKLTISAVFCSPALRCLQSCVPIVQQQEAPVPICVEPGLFEPLPFYWKDHLPKFLTVEQMRSFGYNVDENYQPIVTYEQLQANLFKEKTPADTYERLKAVTDNILEMVVNHANSVVLVVAHAPSIDAIVRHAQGRTDLPRTLNDLVRMGLSYPFCSTTVLERDAQLPVGSKENKWTLNTDTIPPTTYAHMSTQIQVPHFG